MIYLTVTMKGCGIEEESTVKHLDWICVIACAGFAPDLQRIARTVADNRTADDSPKK